MCGGLGDERNQTKVGLKRAVGNKPLKAALERKKSDQGGIETSVERGVILAADEKEIRPRWD